MFEKFVIVVIWVSVMKEMYPNKCVVIGLHDVKLFVLQLESFVKVMILARVCRKKLLDNK